MSKAVKKVTKSVKKFASKSIKMFDPGMDKLLGISAGEEQKKQADRMARIQEQQAQTQAASVAEQARGAAMSMQTDADRQRILAEQQNINQPTPAAPEVDLAPATADAIARRKKFQAPQVGGASGGGASIRL